MEMMILKIIAIIILAPILGGLIAGVDRIISARMQGRKGPRLLQPFYDVLKLLGKESLRVNKVHGLYIYLSFIFMILTTVLILSGGDILLAVFSLTLSSVMFILGGYASNSPYSTIGAERELLAVMAYEPMVILAAIGLYYINNSFLSKDIINSSVPAIAYLPAIFLGFVYILTFKLRKSPFDLSTSEHGHQELVKGITTEYSGKDLAVIQVMHWYETVIAMAFVYMFIATAAPISHLYAVIVCIIIYLIEILIDNSFSRVKWKLALKSAWIVTIVLGTLNLVVLQLTM
ncbi:complex I subunit 1 family protein [Parasporobacterium paucivorans]|uniref:Ech hydrogenase subunit B n=1 Tax=Parasporobacterium paucivorans DSM 15970 TaxID=1122934 RepID=A0A1M6KXH5_9FIRM|nr:complex I subunit 1 family protein [Parasporobacterium paucivorans]SHJ63681.1 ech hydrogenase subunit B [Parasporobacterium paucivorans DSM 15970]